MTINKTEDNWRFKYKRGHSEWKTGRMKEGDWWRLLHLVLGELDERIDELKESEDDFE